jgi:SAM-dependent methyltransferase
MVLKERDIQVGKLEFMEGFIQLSCFTHGLPLDQQRTSLVCGQGCSYEILNNIPRFVTLKNYASSFGLQWNMFRVTQLDSYTGLTISRDRITRIAGGTLEVFKGGKTLEVGCGAGRFTEIILEAGGWVFAIDLSEAVEANYLNCSKFEHYFVSQADILNLPVLPEQFDIVVCIGVIQHTPDPEMTMKALCSQVKPGGMLLIDHYSKDYPVTLVRRWLRSLLLGTRPDYSMHFIKRLVKLLWPLHQFIYHHRDFEISRRSIPVLMKWSPVVDYHYMYPELDEQKLYEWAVLDTHDTLTDRYKHLRSAEEIESALHSFGMVKVETTYSGNGVEARAWKPGR